MNGTGGANLGACAAVRAQRRVNMRDVAFGNSSDRAFADACTACNAIFGNLVSHILYLLIVVFVPANLAFIIIIPKKGTNFVVVCIPAADTALKLNGLCDGFLLLPYFFSVR